AGTNKVFGLVNGSLTPAALGASGNLAVALEGNTLTVAGPGGAGFSLVGNWVRSTAPGSTAGTVAETFTATGSLTLQTAVGDLPLIVPTAAPLQFTTVADTFTNFGDVSSVSWNSAPPLDTNAAGGPLLPFLNQFGVSLTTPSVQWGLKLGRDLHSLDAPLNDAVPYIFFSVNNFTLTLGGKTVPALDVQPLTVLFDPSDP